MRKINIYAELKKVAFDLMHKVDKECIVPSDCVDCPFMEQEVVDEPLCDILSHINALPEARDVR